MDRIVTLLRPNTREEAVNLVAFVIRDLERRFKGHVERALRSSLEADAVSLVVEGVGHRWERAGMENALQVLLAVREYRLTWVDVLPDVYSEKAATPRIAGEATVLRLVKGGAGV